MQLNAQTQSMRQLVVSLEAAGGAFTPRVAGLILMDASKPLLTALQQEVPVGKVPQYQSSVVVRGRRKGQSRTNQGYYARGGALRRAQRLRLVNPEGNEDARVIAGASKATGFVGWRAQFPIYGTVKMPRNDYPSRAYGRTSGIVIQRVENSGAVIIKKKLKQLAK